MLLFLDLAYDERARAGRMRTRDDLEEAVVNGAVKRVRSKMMTGCDVMKRIAAPMVGGLFTSFLLELLVQPAIYAVWKWRFDMKAGVSSDVPNRSRIAALRQPS